MRTYLTVLALLLPGACAQAPLPPASTQSSACSEPRPQVCTMIYAPVCAVHDDGGERTHASSCNACADATVSVYRDGSCEEDLSL